MYQCPWIGRSAAELGGRWRRKARFELAVVCGLTLVAISGPAMTVAPPTFDELVAESAVVVRTEVLATESRLEQSMAGLVIHTYVRCRALRALKGATEQEEFTLVFQGGDVGEWHMVVPGLPRYVAGDRCVLFIAPQPGRFCPLVAAQHGSYRLVADPVTGTERVLRDNLEPLADIAQVARPIAHADSRAARELPASRGLALDVFERLIVDKFADQTRHARQH